MPMRKMANTTGISILANGKCSVCEMLYDHSDFILGDIRENTIYEIWNSNKAWSLYSPIQEQQKNSPDPRCPQAVPIDKIL